MINSIINNPYRILGVFSNSPKKDLVANKGKIQAFLRVNKTMSFKLDLNDILPSPDRTQSTVDKADSELTLVSGQIKHAQFWFVNKTPMDGIAFNHLFDGNIDMAIDIWNKNCNPYSLQNLFVCYLIKDEVISAINKCAIPLYNQHYNELISVIDEKANFSSNELVQNIISTLSEDGVNLLDFVSDIHDSNWIELIQESKLEPLISNLNSQVEETKKSKGANRIERLKAGNKLKKTSLPILETLKGIITISDTRYQIIADKVSQEVLQCSIDYFLESRESETDYPAKALPLCEYALSIAIGNAAKQRCKENYTHIKEAFDNMPPQEVSKEDLEIRYLFKWFKDQKNTSKNGLELLKKAQKPLRTIKEELGKTHKYYLNISSRLGSAALGYVIEEVNEAQKEDKPSPFDSLLGKYSQYSLFSDMLGTQERRRLRAYTLKSALHDAWQTIVYIDLLDKTDEFNQNRYQPNRKTLYSIINDLKGFSYPDENYIIRGCAHNVSANKKFFMSDTEYFNSCNDRGDYEEYMTIFPEGKHTEKAKARIEEIKQQQKNTFILVAIVVAIILFLIVVAANAKTPHNKPYIIPSSYIENKESNIYVKSSAFVKDNEIGDKTYLIVPKY